MFSKVTFVLAVLASSSPVVALSGLGKIGRLFGRQTAESTAAKVPSPTGNIIFTLIVLYRLISI